MQLIYDPAHISHQSFAGLVLVSVQFGLRLGPLGFRLVASGNATSVDHQEQRPDGTPEVTGLELQPNGQSR